MTTDEILFIELIHDLGKKEKISLITAIRHMMEMDTEGTFYSATDNLTRSGILMKDFIKLLKKRGEKSEGIS